MSIEKQLANIANKAMMHQFIDELPEGVEGIIATLDPADEDSSITVFTLGPVSRRDVLWVAHHVMQSISPVELRSDEETS